MTKNVLEKHQMMVVAVKQQKDHAMKMIVSLDVLL